ncbi:hypothetical protein ACG74X_13380 [Marivita sp. S0852]|uniref:hypothetical protein n=1 Tax=Marivita sp. S0852 TaxID=3373893 RepID=UPI0039824907
MNGIFYSHRLKSYLQQMVCELGLAVTIDDSRTDLNLAEHEKMMREAASMLNLQIHFQSHDDGLSVTFYK